MKILFVDDEYEDLDYVCATLEEFYGKGNVVTVKYGPDALELIKNSPFLIDLAIIDQKLTEDMSGTDLAIQIGEHFPYISMIMLSGNLDLSLSKQAMRIGFCDVLDKASDIIPEKFTDHLTRIGTMPAVFAKLKLKKETQYKELKMANLKKELNALILELPFKKKKPGKAPNISVEDMMDYQEEALKQCKAKRSNPLGGRLLGLAILIQEMKKQIGVNDINMLTVEAKQLGLIVKDSRATVQMRFKLFKDDVITETGYKIYHLLKAYPARWETTISYARSRGAKKGMQTFLDRLIKDYL